MLLPRPFRPEDAAPLCAMLNEIIAAGGTTAHERPFTPERLSAQFFTGPHVLTAFVVEAEGAAIGFQSLERHPDLEEGWGDIGTFTRRRAPVPGAGRALFAATLAQAQQLGLSAINASIRADNAGGLRFYRGLGFELYASSPAVPLKDGRPVDRLHHRYKIPQR